MPKISSYHGKIYHGNKLASKQPSHDLCVLLCVTCTVQCFEGMKAYRGADGKIRLFRPMENMNRMKRSAVAASLPVSLYMYVYLYVDAVHTNTVYMHVRH